MPELPKLSQVVKGLARAEDTFESTVSQATGMTPPQGPMKTLASIMEQVEATAPTEFPLRLPEKVEFPELPQLQLPQIGTIASERGVEEIEAKVNQIGREVESLTSKISDINIALRKIETALREIPEIAEKVREESKTTEESETKEEEGIDF